MWQTDIFTFRLGGKYAYAVAFLDDYSRYVVNLELYRSPTAESVVETYRVAVGEYNPPKEMLTTGGRSTQLAGQEPLRLGAGQGPGGAPRVAAAAPDDARQGGALLGDHVAGVFGAGAV
jgi:transposase InsO family protein